MLPLLALVWHLSSRLTTFANADKAQAEAIQKLTAEVKELRDALGKVSQLDVVKSRINRMEEDLGNLRRSAGRQRATLERIVAHLEAKGARIASIPDLDFDDENSSKHGREDPDA